MPWVVRIRTYIYNRAAQVKGKSLGKIRDVLKAVTPVSVRRRYLFTRLVLAECWEWRRGRLHRTRAHVIRQYSGRTEKLDLKQPLWAVCPDGRMHPTTLGYIRGQNWRLIAGALAELGVVGGTILEIGAGDGTNLAGMRQVVKEARWFGFDLVPRERGIVQCDAGQLPLPDGSVDAVITHMCLEQMPDRTVGPAIQEIVRVSKLGLVCIEPDYQWGGWAQRLYMIRRDYVRDIVGPANKAGLTLLRRERAYGGNPLNRPSLFVFGKSPA